MIDPYAWEDHKLFVQIIYNTSNYGFLTNYASQLEVIQHFRSTVHSRIDGINVQEITEEVYDELEDFYRDIGRLIGSEDSKCNT